MPQACKQENVEIDLKKGKREYLRIVSSILASMKTWEKANGPRIR